MQFVDPTTTAHNSCHNFQMRFVQKFVPERSGGRERRDTSWPGYQQADQPTSATNSRI